MLGSSRDAVAEKDPAKAADLFVRVPEYHVPKLARTESTLNGDPIMVVGVGPGTALVNQVTLAQTYYAANDIPSTCAQLTGFSRLVKAQSGKKIGQTWPQNSLRTMRRFRQR